MRKWTSDGGVSQVTVREENGVTIASDGGPWFAVMPGTLHETETDAKRAWLREQETRHENALDRAQGEIVELRTVERRIALLLQAAWRERDEFFDLLAAVRAQLAELEATEGRR